MSLTSGLRAPLSHGTCFCDLEVRVECEYKQTIVPQHDRPEKKVGTRLKCLGGGVIAEVTLALDEKGKCQMNK